MKLIKNLRVTPNRIHIAKDYEWTLCGTNLEENKLNKHYDGAILHVNCKRCLKAYKESDNK